jgi:hypothetical protein
VQRIVVALGEHRDLETFPDGPAFRRRLIRRNIGYADELVKAVWADGLAAFAEL